jgi:hypothetical protein
MKHAEITEEGLAEDMTPNQSINNNMGKDEITKK